MDLLLASEHPSCHERCGRLEETHRDPDLTEISSIIYLVKFQ